MTLGMTGPKGRVLVIDDEPTLVATLRMVLAEEGYEVEVASSGREGLAAANTRSPDVILLDLMMPGMNGRQFLEALRAMPHLGRTSVLLMTAVHGLHLTANSLVVSDFLEKPFEADELLNKVALAMYRAAQSQPGGGVESRALLPAHSGEIALPKPDRGRVVLIVDRDREMASRLDVELSRRGYTVVATADPPTTLPRLARAISPLAILVDVESVHAEAMVAAYDEGMAGSSLLLFARGTPRTTTHKVPMLARASNAELVAFVEGAARNIV